MATYLASNSAREIVTLVLSNAEANALATLADAGCNGDAVDDLSPASKSAANRALDALNAATNTSARRAGYFDT